MTQTPNDNANINKSTRQPSVNLHQHWWDHRFSVSDISFEDNIPNDEYCEEFWTRQISDNYNGEHVENDKRIELTLIGDPPEDFSDVVEVLAEYHRSIQNELSFDSQLSPETTIESIAEQLPRVGPVIVANLKKEGYETFGDLNTATRNELIDVDRVGAKTADRLLEVTRNEIGSEKDISGNNRYLREIPERIPQFGDTTRKKLEKAGYKTVGDIRTASRQELMEIEQIGERTVSELIQYVEQQTETSVDTTNHEPGDETPVEEFAEDVPRVGRVLISKLNQSGYETVGDLRSATVDELTNVDYLGQKLAETLLEHV